MSRTYPPIPAESGALGYGIAAKTCFIMQKNKAQCAACPVCDQPTLGMGGNMADGKTFIRFLCGGEYRSSVDPLTGEPAWTGSCGAELHQKEMEFDPA